MIVINGNLTLYSKKIFEDNLFWKNSSLSSNYS